MLLTLSVTSTGIDPAADIARLVALQRTLPGDLAQVAVDVGVRAVLDGARAARGGSLTMSNNKAARGELDALPIVRGGGGGSAEAEIQAVPRGAWHLANYGARAHEILPKKRRTRPKGAPKPKRRKGKSTGNRQRALNTPYGVFAVVQHPGTAGDRSWERGMEAAESAVDRAVQTAFAFAVEG